MRDQDIRYALLKYLHQTHDHDPSSMIIEELGLCQGAVRVDISVINNMFLGYEIKSDRDTLERLPAQERIYSGIFDQVTIITSMAQAGKIKHIIPNWWGIWRAKNSLSSVEFEIIRESNINYSVIPEMLVQCLWKSEVLQILKEKGLEKRLTKKPRSVLWKELVANVPLDELKTLVRKYIKARVGWRIHELPKSYDDLSRWQSLPLVKLF